jgi:hypothetical protein
VYSKGKCEGESLRADDDVLFLRLYNRRLGRVKVKDLFYFLFERLVLPNSHTIGAVWDDVTNAYQRPCIGGDGARHALQHT